MSRTYKDVPWKFSPCNVRKKDNWVRIEYELESPRQNWRGDLVNTSYYGLRLPGVYPKRKKSADIEYHWMSTPSWWTRETMNRPARKTANKLTREAVRLQDLESLEDFDIPFTKNKPHIYYW